MHYQAGIDWLKAARLAMGAEHVEGRQHDNSTSCPATPVLDDPYVSSDADAQTDPLTIKYPPMVGKHLKRHPERDSFLRGGTQFKSFQHGLKSR